MAENNTRKNVKRYKCPYCEKRLERDKLQYHIGKLHSDMIPEGYTASRVAFNYLNKKTEGHCIICGGVTDWNEDKKRYERLCNSPTCKKKYVKMTEERLKKARGVTKKEMLSNPEFQDKMLKNRSISGEYKFEDGGKLPYVGSYEKNFLEFMDKYLHIESGDIQAPGPTIEYIYNGKKHFWITDFYYTPYNLVFDIKDGGKNPNKREMPEYRAKQRCKEKAIREQGEYNYLRLTDNQFDQLIEIMIDLKDSMTILDGPYYQKVSRMKPIVKINESSVSEGTFNRIYGIPYKVGKQMKKDGVKRGMPTLLKNHGNESMNKVIMREKDIEDIKYIRRDNTNCISMVYTIRDRIDNCKKYGECEKTHMYYKAIKTNYVDQGVTVRDCDLTIEGLRKSNQICADRIKELEAQKKAKSVHEVFCEDDPEFVTFKVLTDSSVYKNHDISELVQYISKISEQEREYIKTFIDTALTQTEILYTEYSHYISSNKCSYDIQAICEDFYRADVTLDDIQEVYNHLKHLSEEYHMSSYQEQITKFDLEYLSEYVL